jgi:hypothetical protein
VGSSALVLVWIAADERIAASKTTHELHNNNQQLTCMFIPMHVPGAPRTSHGCPAVFRGSQQPGAAEAHGRSVFNTRLSRPDEHLAPQRRLGSLGRPRTTYSTDSQALTPQEAHGRRSSNGRQAKVLVGAGQPVRPPGTEHPPRAILAAHCIKIVKHLDHLVSRSSYRVKLLLQLPRVYQPRHSRPGWP